MQDQRRKGKILTSAASISFAKNNKFFLVETKGIYRFAGPGKFEIKK